ncbi:hypothetical protein L5876_08480 [Hyphobacterium sp. SN044]|uniref:hypothetical protein n=1 Tax=Hyphobacterium sp. SN044 TaxID=2912575 RepID=UPI001F3E2E7C|nr:hypothetical protein [Hyphobacterium sp. SN044]MCF8879846.1 hypothetical protein [Hyphobacterium sp. SN044]
MILSRITKAIREQNWFAVVLEFVIVILGVVIGFQVTAWNARQADLQRGQLYIERLSADLAENRTRAEGNIAFRAQVRALGLDALAFASGERQPDSSWQVVATYFNASQSGSAYPVRATYEEMLSTGDLRLIADLDLRNALSVYYTDSGITGITDALPPYRAYVRTLIPIELQEHIWDNCYSSGSGTGNQQVLDCPPPETSPHDLEALAARLLNDERLNGELRFWVSTQRAALVIYDDQLRRTLSLHAALTAGQETAP